MLALLLLVALGPVEALEAGARNEAAVLSAVNVSRAQGLRCAGTARPRSAPLMALRPSRPPHGCKRPVWPAAGASVILGRAAHLTASAGGVCRGAGRQQQ
ncbi:hypothetical protein [Deinococcus sp.]|uniref:hypothetical protein n=1 Tax=Deinococcus sp. TaxID=47478 RepID=UPI003B593260